MSKGNILWTKKTLVNKSSYGKKIGALILANSTNMVK
jgi:hypothetical protein